MNWIKLEGTTNLKENLIVFSESGHKISFEPNVKIWVDLDRKEGDLPFFFVEFPFEYKETDINGTTNMSLKDIKELHSKRNLEKFWQEMESQGY